MSSIYTAYLNSVAPTPSGAGKSSIFPDASGNWFQITAAGVITALAGGGSSGLTTKAGVVDGGAFSGTPQKATVTFSTAFSDDTYAILITGSDGRTYTYETKTAAGFTINANAAAAILGEVSWSAMAQGET